MSDFKMFDARVKSFDTRMNASRKEKLLTYTSVVSITALIGYQASHFILQGVSLLTAVLP